MLGKYKVLLKAFETGPSQYRSSFHNVLRKFSNKEKKELLDLEPIRAKFGKKVTPLPDFAKAVEVHQRDIVIYKSDTTRYFNLMNAFGCAQLVFWYNAAFLFRDLKPYRISEEIRRRWYQKLNYYDYKKHLMYGSFLIGTAVFGFCVYHTMRSVRHVILKKGGSMVELGTYVPVLPHTRTASFKVNDVSCVRGRSLDGYSIIKVNGRWNRYFLDCEGLFVRPDLYDKTLGVTRKL